MTERKPRTMSVDDWVEGQIHRANAEGAFDNLPGAGKPIAGLDREQDPLTWVVNKLRSEQVDLADILPPQLALAREAERVAEHLRSLPSEAMVLAYLSDLNDRISLAHARPAEGPPMRTKLVKVEPLLEQWREYRASLRPARPPVVPVAGPRRRRLTGWLTRRSGERPPPA
jgi:hypothetical protein